VRPAPSAYSSDAVNKAAESKAEGPRDTGGCGRSTAPTCVNGTTSKLSFSAPPPSAVDVRRSRAIVSRGSNDDGTAKGAASLKVGVNRMGAPAHERSAEL